jgi:hypothetical protein
MRLGSARFPTVIVENGNIIDKILFDTSTLSQIDKGLILLHCLREGILNPGKR